MDIDEVLLDCEDKMDKAVEYFSNELRGVRTGRATPALVEFVKVDYYGSMTDMRQLANISVPEPTQLLIKPHDPSSVDAIVKAIQNAGLGLTPNPEGKQVRLNLPPLSGERRQQLAASVKQMAEQAKVAIRNVRRDANKHIDQLAKDKDAALTEDDAKSAKDEVQNLTKTHEGKVESLSEAKQKEVLD
ncbi:MAG: ribosome recycling factor [Phycisphaeraceae bacterium]|nr:ribosome recycling factor [Phycisphaeraceae bacterium]